MDTLPTEPTFIEKNRVLVKGFLIAILIPVMLIPGGYIADLVKERQARQEEVVNEVSSKWAGKQTVTGPMLMLPYKEYVTAPNGKTLETIKTAYILPDELHITGAMQPTEKKRSLYSVMLYHANLKLTGKFGTLPLAALQIAPESVQ